MAVSKEVRKVSSSGLKLPEDAPSKVEGKDPQLLDSKEGKVSPKDSVESPSEKKNETDLSSKSNPNADVTVSDETQTEGMALSKKVSSDFSNDKKGDEDEANEKNTVPVAESKEKDSNSSPGEPEEEDPEETPEEDGPEEAEEDEKQENEDEKEEAKCDKPKRVTRARRACSAVVNYKISDSDSESEPNSIDEDTVAEDGDYNDEEAGDDGDDSDDDDVLEIDDEEEDSSNDSNLDMEEESEARDEKETKESAFSMEGIEEENNDTDNQVDEEEEEASCSSRGKKRRTSTTKTNKTKACHKKEEGPAKKKSKGPRVSEAVIKHTCDQMLVVLIQKYMDGIKEVPMDDLAISITNKKGKPYTSYRSDAIAEAMKRLKAQNKAEKIKYKNTGAARLTEEEISKIPKEEISSDPQKVLEQRHAQFLEKLSRHKKGGNGKKLVSSAKAVWDKLLDGKAYTSKELVSATEYSGTNSSGFEAIMGTLKASDMIEAKSKGKYSFTEKIFPHGRP